MVAEKEPGEGYTGGDMSGQLDRETRQTSQLCSRPFGSSKNSIKVWGGGAGVVAGIGTGAELPWLRIAVTGHGIFVAEQLKRAGTERFKVELISGANHRTQQLCSKLHSF